MQKTRGVDKRRRKGKSTCRSGASDVKETGGESMCKIEKGNGPLRPVDVATGRGVTRGRGGGRRRRGGGGGGGA